MIKINDRSFLAAKRASLHPSDTHIFVVMYVNRMVPSLVVVNDLTPQYVVHTYNAANDSMSSGDYTTNLSHAMECFNRRGTI